jgi:hypothetical protein
MDLIMFLLSLVGAIELIGHFFGSNKSLTLELATKVVDRVTSLLKKP